MYPSAHLSAPMVYPSAAYPGSAAAGRTSRPPQQQQQQQAVSAAGNVTEVFDPDFKYIYDVPAKAVAHLPPARLNITRLVLCRNYRPYDPQSCAMGSNCKFVHADCDYTKLEAHPIHVNYIWRNENLCTYPRLPPGDVLNVWAPNNKLPATLIPSERILVTKGSQAYMICLQSVRSGLASPAELETAAPLSHCAHYYFNRMCNRGERCNFIHAVHVDPTVQGDFKRAPGRGQNHPHQGEEAPRNTAKNGGRGGNRAMPTAGGIHSNSNHNNNNVSSNSNASRSGPTTATMTAPRASSDTSSRTKAPSISSGAPPSEKITSTPASVKSVPHTITDDNVNNTVNTSPRSTRPATEAGARNDESSGERHADAYAALPTDTATLARSHAAQAEDGDGGVNTAPNPREQRTGRGGRGRDTIGGGGGGGRSRSNRSGGGNARGGLQHPPPPLRMAALQTVGPVSPNPPLQQQAQQPQHYDAGSSVGLGSAATMITSAAASDRALSPSPQPLHSLTALGSGPQTQSALSHDAAPQAGGGGPANIFTPPQLTWLAQSDSESSHFLRTPQYPPPPPQQLPMPMSFQAMPHPAPFQQFPQPPLSPNAANYEYGSLNDSGVLNASHTSYGGASGSGSGRGYSAYAAAPSTNQHGVNVIARTRRRREGQTSTGGGGGVLSAGPSVVLAVTNTALGNTVGSLNDKSSSTPSVQSPTMMASAGNSSTAFRSPQGHPASSDSPYNTSLSTTATGALQPPPSSSASQHAQQQQYQQPQGPQPHQLRGPGGFSASSGNVVSMVLTDVDALTLSGPMYRRQSARGASSHSSGGRGTGGTVHSRATSFVASPVVSTRGTVMSGRGAMSPVEEVSSPASVPWAPSMNASNSGILSNFVGPSGSSSSGAAPALPPPPPPTPAAPTRYAAEYAEVDDAPESLRRDAPSGSASRLSWSNTRLSQQQQPQPQQQWMAGVGGRGGGDGLTHPLPNFRLERVGRANSGSDAGAAAMEGSTSSQSRLSRFRHDPYVSGNAPRQGGGRKPSFDD